MQNRHPFQDRHDAGRVLAKLLAGYREQDVLVLALPRGGVPVAFEIAEALHAELDLLIVRKLGVPRQPELAFGAIASGGSIIINQDVVRLAQLSRQDIDSVLDHESAELQRREQIYRGNLPALNVQNRIVILVDDGLATGASMEAAIAALRKLDPARIVAAVPVAAAESAQRISRVADEIVCASQPALFRAVGEWYEDFSQVRDDEVSSLLARHRQYLHGGNRQP